MVGNKVADLYEDIAFHLPCNSRIAINPPGPSNSRLSFEYPKLVEAKLLLQLARHGNARSSGTDDDDWIVSVCIVLVAVHAANSFRYHYGGK